MQRAQRDAEFTDYYGARVRALRRVAYLVVRDWHAAEDVTQRAMVKVYRALAARPSSSRTWEVTMAEPPTGPRTSRPPPSGAPPCPRP